MYENVTFGEADHLRIADEEGMFERTVTLCSASKLFSLTGEVRGQGTSRHTKQSVANSSSWRVVSLNASERFSILVVVRARTGKDTPLHTRVMVCGGDRGPKNG